ncbi:MAG TPA: folylpolyglutamate synthase/dihydrofolate synthase family protein, partial [Gemmatimonadaceae bacterium]|nr:folylpolyglutamate synthase/dihydrofolate synthase family protein [Gemmatimonadaceae bacterium]
DYHSALEYLFARTTGAFKFGLERTRALLAEMGDPHLAIPSLHVAGTNGKGSCVATAEAMLRAKGLRVARYTSPHLVDFRERIVVSGVPIGPDAVVEFIDRWTPTIERIGASFFEATTAMAFQHFARARADVSLIETGLGGRLDSTNVVVPRAAGVISIGYDHQEYLGPTLESIAAEKAGIFKPGAPAVIGEPEAEVADWLASSARAAGASAVRLVRAETRIDDVSIDANGTSFTLDALGERTRVCTPLLGRHQATNFAFTLVLLDAAGAPYASTLGEAADAAASIRLPGRLQRVGRWIFDVAHNADGARTLATTLSAVDGAARLTVLLCVLGDKDWRAMLEALLPVARRFVLTDAPTAPASRRWPLRDAAEVAAALGVEVRAIADFDAALAAAATYPETTLVTGSFHTVGDAMARLQVSPLSG